jgi:hypothetical protein
VRSLSEEYSTLLCPPAFTTVERATTLNAAQIILKHQSKCTEERLRADISRPSRVHRSQHPQAKSAFSRSGRQKVVRFDPNYEAKTHE